MHIWIAHLKNENGYQVQKQATFEQLLSNRMNFMLFKLWTKTKFSEEKLFEVISIQTIKRIDLLVIEKPYSLNMIATLRWESLNFHIQCQNSWREDKNSLKLTDSD